MDLSVGFQTRNKWNPYLFIGAPIFISALVPFTSYLSTVLGWTGALLIMVGIFFHQGNSSLTSLRKQSSFLSIFQDGLRPQGTFFFEYFFKKCVKEGWLQWHAKSLKFFFCKTLALESSKVERDRHFPRWISPIFQLFFQNFFRSTQSFNPSVVTRKLFRSCRYKLKALQINLPSDVS